MNHFSSTACNTANTVFLSVLKAVSWFVAKGLPNKHIFDNQTNPRQNFLKQKVERSMIFSFGSSTLLNHFNNPRFECGFTLARILNCLYIYKFIYHNIIWKLINIPELTAIIITITWPLHIPHGQRK